jgi:hypothetical protein
MSDLRLAFSVALAASLSLGACHRKVEPYDPNEQALQPDLSKIFPEGAERAMGAPAQMPPSPQELAGGPPAVSGMTAPENAGLPIVGVVRLAQGAEVPAGALLFVIARTGPSGPPTAVLRVPAPRFPFEFRLGPENRMIAALPWQGPFQLSARVDLDGNASTRDAGGLEGRAAAPVAPGDAGVEILLEPLS